jgi:hypothetical protein
METTRHATYGGLPLGSGLGPALAHYLGRGDLFVECGRVLLLGCTCGDWGCYPLFAWVDVNADVVRWADFEQPNHPERDYSGFGPFVFDRTEYESAIEKLGDRWPRATTDE